MAWLTARMACAMHHCIHSVIASSHPLCHCICIIASTLSSHPLCNDHCTRCVSNVSKPIPSEEMYSMRGLQCLQWSVLAMVIINTVIIAPTVSVKCPNQFIWRRDVYRHLACRRCIRGLQEMHARLAGEAFSKWSRMAQTTHLLHIPRMQNKSTRGNAEYARSEAAITHSPAARTMHPHWETHHPSSPGPPHPAPRAWVAPATIA